MWTFFVLSMILICVAIVLLVRRYAEPNVDFVVRVATGYAWLTSMMIIALVPIDVWSTLVRQPSGAIGMMWNIAYWIWTSLKENGILYGSVAALGVVGVVILALTGNLQGQEKQDHLIGLGIGLSNTFGLVAGILLLGYGLVEIPKNMWKTSNPNTALKWCAHRAGKFAEAVMKTTQELESVITIVYANQRQMRRHDPLRPYMDIIADYAEKESPVKPSEMAQRNVDIENLRAEDLEYNYDKQGLAALRRRMNLAISEYRAARCQYEEVMEEAFELEDVIKCRQTHDYTPRVECPKPWTKPLWVYKCVVRPYAHRIFAVVLVLTSLCIIWGEAVIPVHSPDLSPFSHVIKGSRRSEFTMQFLVLLPLAYICACSYMALFRINAFDFNKLVPRASRGYSLMQNGSLMCRFAAPTCWNFYHIIRMTRDTCSACADDDDACIDDQCPLTVFSQKMASMDVLLFTHFNVYLPVVLTVHCAMMALGVWERLFSMCVSAKYKFSTDDVDDEYTEKGRLLIRKEQEATGKGFRIGEVLHSAYFDLEFPTIANAGRPKPKKPGLFGKLFGKKSPSGTDLHITPSAASGSGTSRLYTSPAAQAASRWVKGGGAAGGSSSSLDTLENPKTSLLGSRFDKSPLASGSSSTADAGGKASSGLDGIFASIVRQPAPRALAPSTVGFGGSQPSRDDAAAKETDTLLPKWGRS